MCPTLSQRNIHALSPTGSTIRHPPSATRLFPDNAIDPKIHFCKHACMEPRQARTGLSGHVTISVRRLFRKEMRPIREINFFRTLSAFQNDLEPSLPNIMVYHPPIHSNMQTCIQCIRKLPGMSSGLEKQNPEPGCLLNLYSSVHCSAVQCFLVHGAGLLPSFPLPPTF